MSYFGTNARYVLTKMHVQMQISHAFSYIRETILKAVNQLKNGMSSN